MAKRQNDYFGLIQRQSAYCVVASNLLVEILSSFNAENVEEYRRQMHKIEHQADEIHHDIVKKLSTEFITPIDQEDVLHLVQIIDDITDALDEVMLDVYMYHIDVLPAQAEKLACIVDRCVKALYEAASELKNFKKPERLRQMLVKVNDIEFEADGAYVEAIHALFGSDLGGKALLGAKAVYEGLENCCDLCEHAADVIEQVIIKNT